MYVLDLECFVVLECFGFDLKLLRKEMGLLVFVIVIVDVDCR